MPNNVYNSLGFQRFSSGILHEEKITTKPYSKIEFVVKKLGVERKAASRYLKELEDIGIVEYQKVGRETLYINSGMIEILKQ